jgi:hypothetical protein
VIALSVLSVFGLFLLPVALPLAPLLLLGIQ